MREGVVRRDLLKLGMASALAHAVSPLMAAAGAAKEKPIRQKLVEKYLKVSKLTLNVGAATSYGRWTYALHFSDTHVSLSDAKDILEGNERSLTLYEARRPRFPISLQTLAATIAYAEMRGMQLLNTGDLFDYRSDANISCIANSFSGRNIFSSLGNHEGYGHHTREMNPTSRETALELRRRFEKAYGQPLLVASKVINGVNFVAFDNGGLDKWFRKERYQALKAELAKDLPTVLMCHKPFDTPEIRAENERIKSAKHKKPWKMPANGAGAYMMTDSDKPVMDMFRASTGQIKAILCGHLHTEWHGEWNGVPMSLAGGNFEGRATEISFV